MGQPKGLMKINGRPWIEEQARRFRDAGGRDVTVVLGFHVDQYRAVLDEMRDVTGVVNPHPELGQFSSLQVGLHNVSDKNVRGVFVLPIDVPAALKETWQLLVQSFCDGIDVSIPVYGKQGGHPVLLSTRFVEKLLAVPDDHPDARLDRQVHHLPQSHIARASVDDPQVIANMNTPADV